MKRDKRFYPLSWSHHDLLVFADHIKMTLTTHYPSYRHSVEELLEKSKAFWNDIFLDHMKAEKEILLSSLSHFSDQYQKEIETINEEFEELSVLFLSISNHSLSDEKVKEKFFRFAELIIHHVRYEERELFPKVQINLPQAEFDRVGKELERKLPRFCRTKPK